MARNQMGKKLVQNRAIKRRPKTTTSRKKDYNLIVEIFAERCDKLPLRQRYMSCAKRHTQKNGDGGARREGRHRIISSSFVLA